MKKFLLLLLLAAPLATFAQDLIIPKQGNPITAYNIEVSDKYIFYTLEPSSEATISRIAKDSVLMVRRADGTALNISAENAPAEAEAEAEENSDFPIINESDIHGSLIAEGNCVYIPTDSPLDYEQAGQKQLKEEIKKWGYWKVVPKLEQAHFVLQFTTQTNGQDTSYMVIRPRKYYKNQPLLIWVHKIGNGGFKPKNIIGIPVCNCRSSEEINANVSAARALVDCMRKIITDTNYGGIFFKCNRDVLNADNEHNNASQSWLGGYTVKRPQ